MKALKITGLLILIAILSAGVIYSVIKLSARGKSEAVANTVKCSSPSPKQHIFTIQHSDVTPRHINARLCGKLTVINKDDRSRLIAFGVHDSHKPYDGVEERVLTQNQQMTVTLNQAGNFIFHDHFDDAVEGTFTVTK